MRILTLDRFKDCLSYDSATGVFRWLISKGSVRKGSVAGHLKKGDIAHGAGYIVLKLDRVEYYAHCLAWFYIHGCWAEVELDHKNRNRSDNRLSNLRLATVSQNRFNSFRKDNTTGVRGVAFNKAMGKWQSYICVNKQQINLGFFAEKSDAILARESAEIKYFGEFSRNAA